MLIRPTSLGSLGARSRSAHCAFARFSSTAQETVLFKQAKTVSHRIRRRSTGLAGHSRPTATICHGLRATCQEPFAQNITQQEEQPPIAQMSLDGLPPDMLHLIMRCVVLATQPPTAVGVGHTDEASAQRHSRFDQTNISAVLDASASLVMSVRERLTRARLSACRHLPATDLAVLSAQNRHFRTQAGFEDLWKPLVDSRYGCRLRCEQQVMV